MSGNFRSNDFNAVIAEPETDQVLTTPSSLPETKNFPFLLAKREEILELCDLFFFSI